jgi:uncharacterized protein (UPF0333 family)
MINWNDPKHLLAAVAVVAVVIVGFYYVISPYQNCMRAMKPDAQYWCMVNKSW